MYVLTGLKTKGEKKFGIKGCLREFKGEEGIRGEEGFKNKRRGFTGGEKKVFVRRSM